MAERKIMPEPDPLPRAPLVLTRMTDTAQESAMRPLPEGWANFDGTLYDLIKNMVYRKEQLRETRPLTVSPDRVSRLIPTSSSIPLSVPTSLWCRMPRDHAMMPMPRVASALLSAEVHGQDVAAANTTP